MNKLSMKGLGPRPTPEELPFVNQQVFFDKFLFASYVLVVEMEKRFPFLSKLPNETCQENSLHTHTHKKKKKKKKEISLVWKWEVGWLYVGFVSNSSTST